jgi:lactate permease
LAHSRLDAVFVAEKLSSRGDDFFSPSGEITDSVNGIKVLLAILPFATLVAGFLLFRLSALMTAVLTCVVEFVVVITYYHLSAIRSIEAGLWGNLTMWSVFILLWSGQIFGQTFRATGLIPVLLDSFGSISPASDRQGRALTMVTLLSGFVGTFNLYAVYPVAIPALAELGFNGIQAAAGYLIYASWCIPFAALFIGAVIASTATNLPVAEIARASGLLTIPLVFVSIYGTYRILGFRFLERGSQTLFWIVSLSNIAGIVLFTQLWPQYHELTLMAGGLIALPLLALYGRSQKRNLLLNPNAASLGTAPVADASASFVRPYTRSMQIKAYVPLLLAIAYAILTHLPAVVKALSRFEFQVAAWGFSPIKINLLTTPAVPLLVAIASCYAVRLKKASLLDDFVRGTRHGASSLSTLLFGSATVYLMVSTGQIVFLGQMLAKGGKTTYEVLDAALIFLGGMTFGQGAPAIFLFSRMQITSAVKLGLPLALLVGLVNLVAMGPTNAVKPALIRFAASLVDIKGRDRDIFRIGLYWGFAQIVIVTITFMVLVHYWK